jgi:NAD(P)-dependent dehydrogenase (short-subunit alcohol dehydrogenase family)
MGELRFDDRVIVITGGGRGIGFAYAREFAARGAHIVINDSGSSVGGAGSDPSVADAAVKHIRDAGGTAFANTESVATADGAEAVIHAALGAFGRLDVVIANAGIVAHSDFPSTDPSEFTRHLEVHLVGSFNVCRAAWPHFVASSYGRIVMTTSAAIFGRPDLVAYGSAKAGIVGLTRSLAAAGEADGIKVNAVAPQAFSRMVEAARKAGRAGTSGQTESDPGENRPEYTIFPLTAVLAHEACPGNGEIYSAGRGRVARIFLAETPGHFAPDLTPESVLANWHTVESEHGYTVPRDARDYGARLRRRLDDLRGSLTAPPSAA